MHRPRFGGVFVDGGGRGRPPRARYQPGIRMILSASGAVFSKCRRWRYLLWRRWDEKRPSANFLMLNPSTADERSEEHTSELQSQSNLVCRLLLEKKKKKK